jgi:glycosyltransferase involved in cell wall biosynthesis
LENLVSVILPVYNSEKYIFEAIQSILEQTYTNFELLILDDGSTDNTLSIIENFKDERVILFKSEKNFGIVHQLNKGIDNSKGEFIARMDADDISFHERFEKQIDFLINNPNIDVLGTYAEKFGDEIGLLEYKYNKPKQISFLMNFYCYMLHPTVMMRKTIFNSCRYSKEYPLAEDFALWCQVDNSKNLHIIEEVLLKYRIHNEQTNQNSIRRQIQLESVNKIIQNKKQHNILDKYFIGKSNNLRYNAIHYFSNDVNFNFRKLNKITKLYLRIYKFHLKIKNNFLNMMINND